MDGARSRILAEKATFRQLARRKRTYTYSGSGTCRRCSKARRFLSSGFTAETICFMAEETLVDKELAAQAVEISKNKLIEVVRESSGMLGKKDSTEVMIQKANKAHSTCKKESYLVEVASKAAFKACQHANNDPDFHVMRRLSKQAEESSKIAKYAAERSQRALYLAMKSHHQNDSRQNQRELGSSDKVKDKDKNKDWDKDEDSDEGEDSDEDSDEDRDWDEDKVKESGNGYAPGPFGIEKLVLVDAKTNKDISGNPLDCKPHANACFDRKQSLNIRADTFGVVNRVHLSISGPIKESRFEGKC